MGAYSLDTHDEQVSIKKTQRLGTIRILAYWKLLEVVALEKESIKREKEKKMDYTAIVNIILIESPQSLTVHHSYTFVKQSMASNSYLSLTPHETNIADHQTSHNYFANEYWKL